MKLTLTKAIIGILGISLGLLSLFYYFAGVIAILISILIITISGLVYGIITKDERLWKPFLFNFIIILIGACLLYFLLSSDL
ncbi:MAG: hypothetical protein LUH22_18745 [Bacteroides sp.]|nr:hypothetical protein [Bacteroides sp.]